MGLDMVQICMSFPPPSYQDLMAQVQGITPDLSKLDALGALIGIPIPIYVDISQYTNEISQIVQYWQGMLSVKTMLAMIQPMVNLLGLSLSSLLPTIPFLGINIFDLIALDANAVKAMVKDAYMQHKENFLNAISAFLPIPIYFDLEIPSFEINAILKAIYNMSLSTLINLATGLIGQVLSKLKINAILSLPAIPSLRSLQDAVMQIVKAKIAETSEIIDKFEHEFEAFQQASLLLNLDINDIFSLISFPQLPVIQFPSPFLPDFSCLSFELREAMQIYMQNIMSAVIAKMVDFVKSVLSVLGIQFPRICIDL